MIDSRLFASFALSLLLLNARTDAEDSHPLTLVKEPGVIHVLSGDEPFAAVDYQNYAKPIVFPIYGPGQIPMTRSYPMVEGVANEATDHPHHKSMWFAHGDVNGVSFWDERGKIVHDHVVSIDEDALNPSVTLASKLVSGSGELVARETTRIAFREIPGARLIDWTSTIHATEGELRFGDTKEGTMAVRVHPNLRLDNEGRKGVTASNGIAFNSEGVKGGEIWGKRARWVDYAGTIDSQRVGIAFLDHPENLRYPTHWHARTYGLFAANPFGLSDFIGNSADGTFTVPANDSVTFHYRLIFHAGDKTPDEINQWHDQFAKEAVPVETTVER